MSGCQCSLATRLVGDGCKHCNPAMYVEIIEKRCEDLELELATLRLTDAEREAVEWIVENVRLTVGVDRAATLRSLLERIGGGR